MSTLSELLPSLSADQTLRYHRTTDPSGRTVDITARLVLTFDNDVASLSRAYEVQDANYGDVTAELNESDWIGVVIEESP